ncbi:tape measure protein [Empedobacter brevis]|uniref:tape measure protein n=1 Tax=Empedobacter brevis TaxID=247 RepID=UPI0023F3AEE4|nr:tape measure protein [Empedobacter brevis]
MDISNGRLGFTQDLDNQKFLNALRQSNKGVEDFNIHLQNHFNQSTGAVNTLTKGVAAFLTVDYATQFVSQLVKVRGEFEQLEIAFTTMLGSKEKADSLMQEIVTFAATTPFGLQSTSEATKMLLAYGESADTALDTMRKLGDIASGVGIPLKDIAYLYGTTMTQGRLYTQDLNQFLGRGIPMMDELAKILGVSKNEVKGLVEAGKVGFPEVQKVIDNLTASGSMFGGLMEAQSKSVAGQIEQLKDAVDVMFNEIGKDSQGFVTSIISGASSVVENYEAIGKTLGVLIGTLGAYKVALLTVSAIESARAKTVANEIANLSISEKMQLGRLAVTQRQAQATLASAEAELVNNQAILTSMRAEVSSLAIKKQKAVALAIERTQLAQTAQVQLALGQAELRSIQATGTAREIKIAQRNVEKAQNAVIATQEAAEVSRKSSLAASQTFYNAQQNLGNQSQRTKIAQTAVSNAQDAVSVATKNLNTASTARLTLAQHAQALSAKAAATWQAFLNATMLANPIVAVTAVVGGLIAAYFLLRDTTTAAEKAQEAYNKTQEEVKSKLDETKQKAEEYINILKDETATVYQQIEAYKALQLLKLKGFENLSQEQIMTMDLIDLKKLLNLAMDDQGVLAQQQELIKLENERNKINKELYEREEAQKRNSYRTSEIKESTTELKKQLEVIEINYNKQIEKINKIKQEQQLANLPLRDRAQYWENEIKKIEEAISENENLNFGVKSTNPLIKDNTDAANVFKVALQSVNINPLLIQLDEAKKQFSAINAEMGGTAIPEIKNKAYYDKYQKEAQFTLDNLDLNDPKNFEKIKALRTIIDGTTNALKKYNNEASKTKSPKPKTPKKSDDPFEIYKKQIQSVKEDYERFVNYMNSDDLVLKNSGKIQYESLSKSGATYEEFLRRLQKQLVGTSNKSALQVKQLRFINDELAKKIDFNAFDKFKEGIENSISESENLLEVLGKIQEEKSKLQGNTDQISVDKLKFLDEKEIENIKKVDDAAKDLIRTLTEESKPLDAINKKFDAQLFLLKKKINDANEEISKLTISAKSSPEGSNERIKIEEQILKLKKEILDTQNLIDFNESKRTVETKNVTNNVDYNKLLSEYQSYEDKIKAIDDKMKADLLTNQNYYESEKLRLIQQGKESEIKALLDIKNAKDAQIKKQATDETSGIVKDQLMGSEEWANLFSNMDEMTFQQIDNLIKEIETKFNQLKGKFNPIDLNAILKQLRQARKILIEKNPFGELAKGFADLFTEAEAGTEKNTDSIVQKWDRVQKALDGSFEFIDDALKSTGALKEGLGETAKAGLQAVTTTISSALAIKATVKSAKEGISSLEKASVILAIISAALQIAQAIAKFLSNIFSKDKKREKQIKEHKRSVDELTNAYKDLEDAVKRALGSDVYSGQKQMIENLKQQQIEYQKMIELEKGKKKKDSGKIKEWEDALRDSKNTIQDILEEIAEDVVQTNAKDLATELGDALVEAFGKGEDAAKAFGEVANNVLKNAVLNQLKKQFLEKQLQAALDKLYKDMGGDDEGNFNWNGLSPEEQQEFRDKLKEISQNFTGMLDEYSDLFKDLVDPNENSLSGAIKGVSEETASLIAGQINAMRLLIVEANQSRMETNRILIQSLERLANIDFNTKAANLMLEKMYSFMLNFKDNTRSYGF